MNLLKVNDEVNWRGSWGREPSKKVKVDAIEINCIGKDGTPVDSVDWSKVNDRSTIIELNNGHWAYGNQITKL